MKWRARRAALRRRNEKPVAFIFGLIARRQIAGNAGHIRLRTDANDSQLLRSGAATLEKLADRLEALADRLEENRRKAYIAWRDCTARTDENIPEAIIYLRELSLFGPWSRLNGAHLTFWRQRIFRETTHCGSVTFSRRKGPICSLTNLNRAPASGQNATALSKP